MVGMATGLPVLLLRSHSSSQGQGLGGSEFQRRVAGLSVLANTLARGYTLNLAASMTGACPCARGVAS
eukprot:1627999-Heterocapsa_arctica.AAC.1